MAQKGSRAITCHTCLQVFRQSRSYPVSSCRSLSSSAPRHRHGLLPLFQPTHSQALSELLETVRNRIFVPAYLSRPQQKLIYETKNHQMLRNESFVVEIGPKDVGDRVLLEPIDRTKDVPNSWKSVLQALRLMATEESATRLATESSANREENAENQGIVAQSKGQWANLVPLLDGMRTAGRRWKTWQWEYMIRAIGEAGGAHALLNAAAQMERTGLYLYHVRAAREIFWACRVKAELGGWNPEAVTKALSYAEQVSRLLEDRRQVTQAKHAVNRGEFQEDLDLLRQPDVIGTMLELSARKAEMLIQENASEEAICEVKALVMMHIARLAPNLDKVQSSTSYMTITTPPAAAADYELQRWVPVLSGLQAAERVLGPELPSREALSRGVSQLEKIIVEARKTIENNVGGDEGGKRRGFKWSAGVVSQ